MTSQASYKREQVIEIVSSVIQRMSTPQTVLDDSLVLELHALKDVIDGLKEELHQAHPVGIQSHIPGASDELDAVVKMTESATNTIMEACESIQKILQDSPYARGADLENEIIRIVEACTFQDITGQRISKITKALGAIEKRANELADILEKNFASNPVSTHSSVESDSLMNGPQLPGQGVSQDDIDKLLNDLF